MPAAEFFVDYFTTALRRGRDPRRDAGARSTPGWGAHYEKFNRVAQAWSIVGVAAAVRVDGGTIAEARVGLTNMGSDPGPGPGVEQALVGQPATAGGRARGGRARRGGHRPPSDANADADYREHLARVLTGRAVLAAAG